MVKRMNIGLIVGIVALAIIAVLSAITIGLGLANGKRGINPAIFVLAACIVVGAILLFRNRNSKRDEMVRRFYISDDGVYNYELGYAPMEKAAPSGKAFEFVSFAADSLAKMSYGFEVADLPEDFKPSLIITTTTLRFHHPEGADEDDDESAVIDEWRGTLMHLATPGEEGTAELAGTYANARELAILLENNEVFF